MKTYIRENGDKLLKTPFYTPLTLLPQRHAAPASAGPFREHNKRPVPLPFLFPVPDGGHGDLLSLPSLSSTVTLGHAPSASMLLANCHPRTIRLAPSAIVTSSGDPEPDRRLSLPGWASFPPLRFLSVSLLVVGETPTWSTAASFASDDLGTFE
jgi:hypothetical protein